MDLFKFGGSSIGSAERIKNVTKFITSHNKKLIVIFSAIGNTTEQIIRCADSAKVDGNIFENVSFVKHLPFVKIIEELCTDRSLIQNELVSLDKQFKGISYLSELYPKSLDYTLALGEIISNLIIYDYIKNHTDKRVLYLDSREVIKTNSEYQNAIPIEIKTNEIDNSADIIIMPGFIGEDLEGNTTTLGRGGGDFTASIIGSELKVDNIHIFSDADGILTANPKIVNKPKLIKSLTYEHAYEISYYGGKILYHKTIKPAYLKNVPIHIRNTFNLGNKGSLISDKCEGNNKVLAITNLDDLTLFKIRGLNFKETIGISQQLFKAISKAKANIYFISQSSSETCIYFCVKNDMAKAVRKEICRKFPVPDVTLEQFDNKSIIAIVINDRNSSSYVMKEFFKEFYDKIEFDLINHNDLSIDLIVNSKNIISYINILHDYFII